MYAENLKKIRKTLHYGADKMAETLEVKARTYGSWERSEATPSMELGTLLCKKLNINMNWFVTGEGEMFNAAQNEPNNDELASRVRQILREEGVIK